MSPPNWVRPWSFAVCEVKSQTDDQCGTSDLQIPQNLIKIRIEGKAPLVGKFKMHASTIF